MPRTETETEYAGDLREAAWAAAHAGARGLRRWLVLATFVGFVALLVLALLLTTGFRYERLTTLPAPSGAPTASADDLRKLSTSLSRKIPQDTYIVIDQTHNRLYLRSGTETLHEAVCSAGSGMLLQDHAGGRRWIFDTPRGRFQVLRKLDDPVWKKPDWAFVEEGKPIPKDPGERIEYGVLGEHALYFGDGYMIHGTLYERLLGRSVTHGCIRLGREDLRRVYKSARIGTPIFIF